MSFTLCDKSSRVVFRKTSATLFQVVEARFTLLFPDHGTAHNKFVTIPFIFSGTLFYFKVTPAHAHGTGIIEYE